MLSPWTCLWPVEMPSSESVNSLHLEAEMPPALTAQGGRMDPVDGQLLANLPDLGVKEEVWVNDGLLSRNPHLGVVHLHIHGPSLIHLLENNTYSTHTPTHVMYTQARACRTLQKCLCPTRCIVMHLHSVPLSHAAAPALSFYLSPLCLLRGQQLPDSWLPLPRLPPPALCHPLLKPPACSFYYTSLKFTDSDDLTFKWL